MKIFSTISWGLAILFSISGVASTSDLEVIKGKAQCTFLAVAKQMKISKKAVDEGPPIIVYSGETSIDEFNRENEGILNAKLKVFTNVFIGQNNKIFLQTDPAWYKAPATALDSLAHEFTHYFQLLIVDRDLTSPFLYSEQSESEAIYMQKWFRETKPCGD
jgi:hypothetical protein